MIRGSNFEATTSVIMGKTTIEADSQKSNSSLSQIERAEKETTLLPSYSQEMAV